MSDEREVKIRESAEEVFKSFLRNLQVLQPDGGSRSLSTRVMVESPDRGYGYVLRLTMIETLEGGRQTTVLDTTFTQR